MRLTEELFVDLARSLSDPVARYERYLAARDASYLQVETGSGVPRVKPPWAELSGYDRIALMTMQGIVHGTDAVIPLDVSNGGIFPFLRDDDVIEVPCDVNREGPRARPVDTVPDHCRALITHVKEYERATIAAALSGSRDDRLRALGLNPLAGPRDRQEALVEALIPS
jgi:6-phospho-beta-glucosidase